MERARQRDRQSERERERETDRQTDRDIQTETETDRQTATVDRELICNTQSRKMCIPGRHSTGCVMLYLSKIKGGRR